MSFEETNISFQPDQQLLLQQITTIPPQMSLVQNGYPIDNMKASPSANSDSSHDGEVKENGTPIVAPNILQQYHMDSPITEPKMRNESWLECFTTTKAAEYEALLFSVYVSERTDKKFDGWTHFDCLHRLQSKCRYRVRAKKQDEFYIVEEKSFHNHGTVEPIGQAGSHAGLPKAIREIVDRSYMENWAAESRSAEVEEVIKKLGLPANPRLGRQIDNRIAYLRRVKNLTESRKMQDQVASLEPSSGTLQQPSSASLEPSSLIPSGEGVLDSNVLQALMERNGGSLVVEKNIVEQLIGPHAAAVLANAQQNFQLPNIEQQQSIQNDAPQENVFQS